MTEKELRKLNKIELLKLLLEMSKENERLEIELEAANKKLNERIIMLEKAGSIVEVSARLNGLFEAAQKTADQYLESVAAICDSKKETNECPLNLMD